jgi:hypothetical protein
MNNSNYLAQLPLEIVTEILLNTRISAIKSMCSTDIAVQQICNSEDFWIDYIKKNYKPDLLTMDDFEDMVGMGRITWKTLAYAYEFGKPVMLYTSQSNEEQGVIRIISLTPDMFLKDILGLVENVENYKIFVGNPISIFDKYDIRIIDGNIQWYEENRRQWLDYEDVPIGANKLYDLLQRIYVYFDQQERL